LRAAPVAKTPVQLEIWMDKNQLRLYGANPLKVAQVVCGDRKPQQQRARGRPHVIHASPFQRLVQAGVERCIALDHVVVGGNDGVRLEESCLIGEPLRTPGVLDRPRTQLTDGCERQNQRVPYQQRLEVSATPFGVMDHRKHIRVDQ
jgi:hypothetical protein